MDVHGRWHHVYPSWNHWRCWQLDAEKCLGVKGPKLRGGQDRILTDPELMLVCLLGWLWPAALLSHNAGLRTHPKSKILRDVPLSARCLTALREHIRDHPPAGALGHVFTNPDIGGRLRPNRVRNQWNRAVALAALDGDKPTWHDLCHGCAIALAEASADPWVIQAILGHAASRHPSAMCVERT